MSDVEDETARALKPPGDANVRQRARGVVEARGEWRPRGVQEREGERDVVRLVPAWQRRSESTTAAECLDRETGARQIDFDVGDDALLAYQANRARPMIAGRRALKMPAFSAAIFSRVSPRYSVWS